MKEKTKVGPIMISRVRVIAFLFVHKLDSIDFACFREKEMPQEIVEKTKGSKNGVAIQSVMLARFAVFRFGHG
jgi:hypothetical protein